MKALGCAVAALLAAFVLVGAGCGGDDEATDDTTATETDTTETDTTDAGEVPVGSTLKGSVGPGFVISVTTEDGAPVETLSAGSYRLALEDLSSDHNFHLSGPGVDTSTDVAEARTQTIAIALAAGTYTFVCDPHASQMSGSFTVT